MITNDPCLKNIYIHQTNNINFIYSHIIKKYKNILIISNYDKFTIFFDYSPLNCNKNKNKDPINVIFGNKPIDQCNIFSIYLIDNNNSESVVDNFAIIHKNKKEKLFNKLKNFPDLILVFDYIDINLKNFFKCPIYQLLPRIFKTNLFNSYKSIINQYRMIIEDHKKYNQHQLKFKLNNFINKFIDLDLLQLIINYDKIYSNKDIYNEILQKIYNINSEIFYFKN